MVVIILALDNAYSIDSVKSIGSDKYIEPTLSRCEAHDPVHGSFINLMQLPNEGTLRVRLIFLARYQPGWHYQHVTNDQNMVCTYNIYW